jgi:DNA polymerase-1
VREYDAAKLLGLFEGFGFRGLADKMRGAAAKSAPAADLFAPGSDGIEFEYGANAPPSDWQSNYRLIDTAEKFNDLLAQLKSQPRFAFDLETTGLDPLRSDIVGIALSWKAGEAYYVAVRGPAECGKLDERLVLDGLKPIFGDPCIAKVNQNIKYDLLSLRHAGIEVRGVAGDPMIADYLLRSGERSHGLDELARKQLSHENIKIEELIGKGKNQILMDAVPTDKVCAYAAEDADVAWRLTEKLEAELTEVDPRLRQLYETLEVPLISVLAEMEFNGIRIDVPFLNRLSGEMAEQLKSVEQEIHQIAGREFNIASPLQLRKVLFEELNLPVQKRTKLSEASSTDQETLERLAPLHPLPRKIVEYRQVSKLKGTYVDALPVLVNPNTSRLHSSFNQTVAATGRLSSTDPNLQNIPARTEQGRQIRQAFLPAEGWRLLTADYSQIELRLLAHLSGDDALRDAFAKGHDIHASVASQIFGVPPDQVNSNQRRVAKTVNFGVIYGMSPHGLAIRLSIERDVAAKFIDDYFARFPAVQAYQAEVLARCARNGYVTSLLGRRRAISGVRSRASYKSLNQPEREAINMEIQGSAADMMKLAMLAVHRRLCEQKMKARMLLTVHDELVFEAPEDGASRDGRRDAAGGTDRSGRRCRPKLAGC